MPSWDWINGTWIGAGPASGDGPSSAFEAAMLNFKPSAPPVRENDIPLGDKASGKTKRRSARQMS